MSASIWDIRFSNRKMAQDAEEGSWITVNGAHVMVNENGEVIKGAEGNLSPNKQRSEKLRTVEKEVCDGSNARYARMQSLLKTAWNQYRYWDRNCKLSERVGNEPSQKDKERRDTFDKKIKELNDSINSGNYMFDPRKSAFSDLKPLLVNGGREYNKDTDFAYSVRRDFFKTLNADILMAQREGRDGDVKNLKASGNRALEKTEQSWWAKRAKDVDDYVNGLPPRIRGLRMKVID